MIDCREHPNEIVLVERLPDGNFHMTQDGLSLFQWCELNSLLDYITALSRQYNRQRKILGGV